MSDGRSLFDRNRRSGFMGVEGGDRCFGDEEIGDRVCGW